MECEAADIEDLRAELAGAEAYIEELEGGSKTTTGEPIPEPWGSVDEIVDELNRHQRESHELEKAVATAEQRSKNINRRLHDSISARDKWKVRATELTVRVNRLEEATVGLEGLIKRQMTLIEEQREKLGATESAERYLEKTGRKSGKAVRVALGLARRAAKRLLKS